MEISEVIRGGKSGRTDGRGRAAGGAGRAVWLLLLAGAATTRLAAQPAGTDPSDPILNLFLQKGFITQTEADKARAEVAALRTNEVSQLPGNNSPFKLAGAVKSFEIFGDVKFRYEDRAATGPGGVKVDLQRSRYALHFGFRGEALDDFYYGFRLETAANPRSPWVTLGQSVTGNPYQGPFGKSTGGLAVGQIYLGWRPESWFDLTVGKMPNPLYTTTMVWDPDLNPEGLSERFSHTVGEADFYASFGQFVYADQNPAFASAGLAGLNDPAVSAQNGLYMITWSGGMIYHVTTNITARAGANLYQYYGAQTSTANYGIAPYFGDAYVGEGAYTGPNNTQYPNGASGYGVNGYNSGTYNSLGYPNNQVGVNDLLILEVPFEVDFKLMNGKLNARMFGDVAYNFDGRQRAEAAQAGYAYYLANATQQPTISAFAPQTSDNKAYQFGVALGNKDSLGMVYTGDAPRHAWEARAYWQHIEQYALDPNLIDSDFFEGAENLQGVYFALAYGFTDNFVGTVRYGYASRINSKLGTGGSNQDLPQVNPIDKYQLFQVDLSYKF